MELPNDELVGLLGRIQSYEPSIYNNIVEAIFYKMKDSKELYEAVKLWLDDESTAIILIKILEIGILQMLLI